jgi:cyclic pyranopterin phosphate synthase
MSEELPPKLTHLDDAGRAHMVAVDAKPETARRAEGRGRVEMLPSTLALIRGGGTAKGDVLATARLAGIMAAKQTATVIPLCHPLRLTSVELAFIDHAERADSPAAIEIRAVVTAIDRTGVEMEALHAVTVAALVIYDMCKAVDRGMRITDVALWHKAGGRSGDWHRP